MRTSHVASIALIAALVTSLVFVWTKLAGPDHHTVGAETDGVVHTARAAPRHDLG